MLKLFIKLLLISVTFIIGSNGCSMKMEDADTCAMHVMLFGNRDAKAPSNDAELDAQCGKQKTNMKCLFDYANSCLGESHKAIANIALTASERHLETQCKVPHEREKYLKYAKCIIPKEKIEPFHICSDKHVAQSEKLLDMESRADRFAASCCIFHMFQECVRETAAKECGDETADYFETLLDEVSDETISFACGEIQTFKDCEKINADHYKMFKEISNTNDPNVLAARHKYKSVLGPMLAVMNKYPNK